MPSRPLRFGVSLWSAPDGSAWEAKARKADDLGFDIALLPDHLAPVFPPMVALAAIASTTSHLRIGTLVLNNDFRHPAITAREAATLAVLSGGRFELGIGAGHAAEEYASIGLPFDRGTVRAARLAEAVGIIKPLLRGERVQFIGKHYSVDHEIFPKPNEPPRLMVGGNSRQVLELAAHEADIVGFTGFFTTEGGGGTSRLTHFSRAGFLERRQVVHAAAGERFNQLELQALIQGVVPGQSPSAAAEEALPRLAGLSGFAPEDALSSPFMLFGPPQAMAEEIQRRREELGLSYFVVFETAIDAFAPVIAALK